MSERLIKDLNDDYFVTSSATAIGKGIEAFGLSDRPSSYLESRTVVASSNEDYRGVVRDLSDIGKFWLPAAAEVLDISPKLDDYVLAITVSMPSDLPNVNGLAFPFTTLTEWHPDDGCPMYETWVGKPVCYEHDNDVAGDSNRAKGIILDCTMAPLKGTRGDIWKVIKLLAIDRTKDAILANDIATGNRRHYSMGANIVGATCSICGVDTLHKPCAHLGAGGTTRLKEYNGLLAYKNAVYPVGLECSSVGVPAYYSASDSPLVESV